MQFAFRTQLILMVTVIGLLTTMIIWSTWTTHRVVGQFETRFKRVEVNSFRIADRIQADVVELRNLVLQYVLHHQAPDLKTFESRSGDLRRWIEQQKHLLEAPRETEILRKVEESCEQYFRESGVVLAATDTAGGFDTPEFQRSMETSMTLLDLGYQLANAHRNRVESFLQAAHRSVGRLQSVIFASLFLLLALGGWLSMTVYRRLLAPLRVRLVESNTLLQRQEKLASLGMLAAGVAHEIRNPLAAIKACLFLQQKRLKTGSPEYRDGENIGKEISRLENIVKQVLQFARPSDPQLETMPAIQPIQQVAALMAPELASSGIRLIIEPSPDVCIRVDRHQIEQVLINLVRNAADSIVDGGRVALRVRAEPRPNQPPSAVLEVSDTGRGIAPEAQERLFDPFFSTKETGTGLGLSIAARIVEKNGGQLQYQTTPGAGTTFGIVFPAVT